MRSPPIIGEWIFIKEFGTDDYIKVKVLGEWKRNGITFLSVAWESGHVEEINWDSIAKFSRRKKAKIIKFKPKLKLLK